MGNMGLFLTSLISKAAPGQEILFTFMGVESADHSKEDLRAKNPLESVNTAALLFRKKNVR